MRVVLSAALMLLAMTASASASGYSEFVAGVSEIGRNDTVAEQHFSNALNDPQLLANLKPVAFLDRAGIYFRQGKYDLALSDLSASLTLHPSFDAYMERAFVYVLTVRLDYALQDASAAIATRPDLGAGYEFRAGLQTERRSLDDAIADATTAIALMPNTESALEERSAIYSYKGDLTSALKDADAAINVSSGSPASLYLKAQTYEAGGKLADALTAIEAVLAKQPRGAPWLIKKGVIQWELRNFADASATFDRVTVLDPSNNYALLWQQVARADAHLPNAAAEPSGADIVIAPPTTDDFSQVARSGANVTAKQPDPAKWPGPLVKLFKGTSTPAAIMAMAVEDKRSLAGRVCQANFYIAQWQRTHGNLSDVAPRLRAAASDCPFNFIERIAAINQLKAME